MRLKTILEDVQITLVDPEENWEWAEEAENIANRSEIRIHSQKQLTLVALDNYNDVVGAVWSNFYKDDEYEEEAWVFDFDVAVRPRDRAYGLSTDKIGPKLIDAALQYYKAEKGSYPGHTYIKCWVVNPKLAKWLETNRGFRTEGGGEWHPSEPHMIYDA